MSDELMFTIDGKHYKQPHPDQWYRYVQHQDGLRWVNRVEDPWQISALNQLKALHTKLHEVDAAREKLFAENFNLKRDCDCSCHIGRVLAHRYPCCPLVNQRFNRS